MGPAEKWRCHSSDRYAIGNVFFALHIFSQKPLPSNSGKKCAGIALLDPYWSRKMPLLNEQEYLQLPRNFGLQGVGNPMGVSKNF